MMMSTLAVSALSGCVADEPDLRTGGEASFVAELKFPDVAVRNGYGAASADLSGDYSVRFAVYTAGSTVTRLTDRDFAPVKPEDGMVRIRLDLDPSKKYDILFWVARPGAPYEFDPSMQSVTVDYAGAMSNDPRREAYYCALRNASPGARVYRVQLIRPFAEVNLGADDISRSLRPRGDERVSGRLDCEAYTMLNLYNGKVSDRKVVSFGLDGLPDDGSFPIEGYSRISTSYVLVPATPFGGDCEFSVSSGDKEVFSYHMENVRLERNGMVNVYGSLGTRAAMNVDISPSFVRDRY